MNRLALLFSFLLLQSCGVSQNKSYPYPKREFRAFWIVTLANKDFPSRPGLSSEEQQAEIIQILDYHQKLGMNAAIFQVRPSADAFYYSNKEPWSEWLGGRQGKEPEPYYDPLAFIIEECHKRNMELHAWFNPFRAVFNLKVSQVAFNHLVYKRPYWFINYANHKQFDPGLPEVRQYITDVVLDVVKRYDVDGVQFDDYFYPYKVGGQDFPDELTFRRHSKGFSDKGDWRRDNINQLIEMIHDSIQATKPHVKFGISPLGIWRNQRDDRRGSATSVGQTSYDYLGADVLKWLEEGWVDYIAPQLYWSMNHRSANYKVLSQWWAEHSYGRHIYIGQAFYKIGKDSDPSWQNLEELPNQIQMNRQYQTILGSIFFRSEFLMDNPRSMSDTLRERFYKYPALIPAMPWKGQKVPDAPRKLRSIETPRRVLLKWKAPQNEEPHYYVIYRFQAQESIDLNDPRAIVSIQKERVYYEEKPKKDADGYFFAVTAVDRLHNESKPNILQVR